MRIWRRAETERKSGEITEEEKRELEAFWAASPVVRDENSEEATLYILEEARSNDCSYILAVDSKEADEDGACHSLKGVSGVDDAEAVYEFVENEGEAGYMLEAFQIILEDEGADIDLPGE